MDCVPRCWLSSLCWRRPLFAREEPDLRKVKVKKAKPKRRREPTDRAASILINAVADVPV